MYKYIFGPVPSRRLGVSLGIDLVEAKTCNLNCIYCECGGNTETFNERKDYVDIEIVKKELTKALLDITPDYITFSGNGEPTLNKSIGKLVDWVKENTDLKVAVITNSSTLLFDGMIEELKNADVIMPSIDAISEDVFINVNRPHATLKSKHILDGIEKLTKTFEGEIYVEVFIAPGMNDTEKEIQNFCDFLKNIDVNEVQLNTLSRPGAVEWIKPATFETLEKIEEKFKDSGIKKVSIIKKYRKRNQLKEYSKENEKLILNMLSKRPYEIEELECVVGEKLHKYLEILIEDKLVDYIYKNGEFYVSKL